jgi:S-adenosylmethionine:tRNA ribosyltransferase-isomerase
VITLTDIDYELPTALIAQQPIAQRDQSRLLTLDRKSGNISHHYFFDLPSLLRTGDVIVRNKSRVIPARLFAKKPTGGSVEVLLLHVKNQQQNTWEVLCRPGLKPQQVLSFPNNLSGLVSEHMQDSFIHEIKFNTDYEHFLKTIELIGETPLPPYIDIANATSDAIRLRYQTTYADQPGSVAAPTAGLHFTKALDKALSANKVTIEEVVLHVGLGTFSPIRDNDISQHTMHSEWFSLDLQTAQRINDAKSQGRRIIAVGTTTVRVLESCAVQTKENDWQLEPRTGETNIYIYPPYQFKIVDGLITNFHLPKSSLLLLVAAFTSEPNNHHVFEDFQQSLIGKAYLDAIKKNYRFFSFGDAMLID